MALYDSPDYYAERGMVSQTARSWEERAHEIVDALGTDVDRILDIGAGRGWLVHGFRSIGLEAAGFEPSEAGRRGALAHGTTLLSALPDEGGFGAVTMLHVLEHVEDPVAMLQSARQRLAPAGRIFIEVPHPSSVDMVMPSIRADVLDLPFHIHHFTPRTLDDVLRRAGFRPYQTIRFNPTAVEQVLNRRMQRLRATGAPASAKDNRDHTIGMSRPSVIRRGWQTALSALRRAAPGPKFQVLARRADDPQ